MGGVRGRRQEFDLSRRRSKLRGLMPTTDLLESVPLPKAIRLLNHGPTVLITAAHAGRGNVMAATWAFPLDIDPPKVMVVIASTAFTRELINASGEFAINVPPVALAKAVLDAGAVSGRDEPDKFSRCGLTTFAAQEISAPLVGGCVGWLECRAIRNASTAQNEKDYDLIIAEVVAARANSRVFSRGHWHFETAPGELGTLHYVAGGHFYTIGGVVKPE